MYLPCANRQKIRNAILLLTAVRGQILYLEILLKIEAARILSELNSLPDRQLLRDVHRYQSLNAEKRVHF